MTDAPRQNARIPELDGLRGIAISLVVIFHSFYFAPPASHHPVGLLRRGFVFAEKFFAIGWTGVDLFFVLSGFLIGGILLDVRTSPSYFNTFYARRFFRIVPVYYAWIGLFLVVTLFLGKFGLGARTAAVLVVFLQNFGLVYRSTLANAWFLPTWSLAVEEQFYLIAPLVIRVFSRRNLCAFLYFVLILAPICRIWIHFHAPPVAGSLSLAYTLMPCRADSLAVGILIALLWRDESFKLWITSHANVVRMCGFVLLAGMLGLVSWAPASESLPMQSVGYTWIALFYGAVMIVALTQPASWIAWFTRARWLAEIGRVSYCLYLIHDAIRVGMGSLIRVLQPAAPSWELIIGSAIAAVISYGVARASWVYFEYPLLRRGHSFKY